MNLVPIFSQQSKSRDEYNSSSLILDVYRWSTYLQQDTCSSLLLVVVGIIRKVMNKRILLIINARAARCYCANVLYKSRASNIF